MADLRVEDIFAAMLELSERAQANPPCAVHFGAAHLVTGECDGDVAPWQFEIGTPPLWACARHMAQLKAHWAEEGRPLTATGGEVLVPGEKP